MELGERIKAARKREGLTQLEWAKKHDVGLSAVKDLESLRTHAPLPGTAAKIEAILQIGELIEDDPIAKLRQMADCPVLFAALDIGNALNALLPKERVAASIMGLYLAGVDTHAVHFRKLSDT